MVQTGESMKSITIHGLEDDLSERITEKAHREGLSLNRTMKNLLRESLGLSSEQILKHREEYMDLFGCWTEEDAREFEDAMRDFTQIDPRDWA